MSNEYRVRPAVGPVNIDVCVPGSKSMTNRALLLAALADGESILRGLGLSDDSRVFMEALTALGFDLTESYGTDGEITVRVTGCGGDIPQKKAGVYVGSAGTAARFLTAMTALSDGCYELTSSDQMKQRPMRELLEALELLGARFSFHEEPYAFPFTVWGRRCEPVHPETGQEQAQEGHTVEQSKVARTVPGEIPLNIDRSSQFLSALLLCGPMVEEGFSVRLTGTREARSYVVISEQMMSEFGYDSSQNQREAANCACEGTSGYTSEQSSYSAERNLYTINPNAAYHARDYRIEPDASAACYFYAMAAVNGGTAHVRGMKRDNTQGDMRFIDLLSEMGCDVGEVESANDEKNDEKNDIVVSRGPDAPLHGVTVDMSDFSDQTMTLAAIAPFADSPTTITGVAHIRGQESNRIEAIVTELTRLGVCCEEREDGLTIQPLDEEARKKLTAGQATEPGREPAAPGEIHIQTYNDHRMAMAFAVTGTHMSGVVIDNPSCCRKTFENYFDILDALW